MIWFGIPLLTKDNNLWYAEKIIEPFTLSLRLRKETSPKGNVYTARTYINTINHKLDLCISSEQHTSAQYAIEDVSSILKKLLIFSDLLKDSELEDVHFGYEKFLD